MKNPKPAKPQNLGLVEHCKKQTDVSPCEGVTCSKPICQKCSFIYPRCAVCTTHSPAVLLQILKQAIAGDLDCCSEAIVESKRHGLGNAYRIIGSMRWQIEELTKNQQPSSKQPPDIQDYETYRKREATYASHVFDIKDGGIPKIRLHGPFQRVSDYDHRGSLYRFSLGFLWVFRYENPKYDEEDIQVLPACDAFALSKDEYILIPKRKWEESFD